ncbi:serine--tRNA ligase [Candidatus Berkelbacteria bacterium]|nr:serine--tRNA ligase [Candidatus Berkelbacteria bacterium]
MIDVELLRKNPQDFQESLKNRFIKTDYIEQFLGVDKKWREIITLTDQLRAQKKDLSTDFNTAQTNQEKIKNISAQISTKEKELANLEKQRKEFLSRIPNLLSKDVPIGEGETANTVIKKIGEDRQVEGISHDQLMTKLGWLNTEAAANTTGARFRYLLSEAASTHLKLVSKAQQFAINKGFVPVITPVMAKSNLLEAGGFFPDGEEDTFKVDEDLYLSGTSEYLLVGLYAGKTLKAEDLPIRLVGFSTCFRKEAGSYGKDTKGMFRVHQFDKVEMVSICKKEDSEKEHQFLLSMQEEFVSSLNLPFQVVLIGSGDTEKKAIKRYDIETWFPGQNKHRETHSVSNCTDYQSRSLGIKVKKVDATEFAHTLNGTLYTERTLLALIENNQTPDGKVNLPND